MTENYVWAQALVAADREIARRRARPRRFWSPALQGAFFARLNARIAIARTDARADAAGRPESADWFLGEAAARAGRYAVEDVFRPVDPVVERAGCSHYRVDAAAKRA